MVALKEPKNIQLMEEFGVLTKTEMLSRYEVEMEHYSKVINIEARTMVKIANKQLIPAVNAYMGDVASTAAAKQSVSEKLSIRSEEKLLDRLSAYADAMSDAVDALQKIADETAAMTDETAKAHALPRCRAARHGQAARQRRRGGGDLPRGITGRCPATAACCSTPSKAAGSPCLPSPVFAACQRGKCTLFFRFLTQPQTARDLRAV